MENLVFLLIFLLLAPASPGRAETNAPNKNYCGEEASWHDWHVLLDKNPEDDALHALYVQRLGLCYFTALRKNQ